MLLDIAEHHKGSDSERRRLEGSDARLALAVARTRLGGSGSHYTVLVVLLCCSTPLVILAMTYYYVFGYFIFIRQ